MDLIESCKRAIKEERCLGCQALESPNFRGNYNCEYSKTQSASESIAQIKKNLGVQERIKL